MARAHAFRVHRPARWFAAIASIALVVSSLAVSLTASTAGAADSNGPKVYIGLFGDNSVGVLDTATDQMLTTIPVPAGPHGMVITPDNRWVYVSSDGASTVSRIDTLTDTVTDSIEVGQTPHGLAITPDGSQVLVAGFGTNMVTAIDTSTNHVAWQVPVASPHNIAISPDGALAYVGSQAAAPMLDILNLSEHRMVGGVALPNVPRALNFSPDGTQLWFTEAGVDEVQVLDPRTNDVVTTIPVGASPHLPAFTPDGSLGMVVSQGPGELWLLDSASDTSIATIKVGDMPHWIAITADSQTAFVTNENSNDLSVVDLSTQAVVDTVGVGDAPRQIVVQTDQATANPAPPVQTGGSVSIAQFAFNPGTTTVAVGHSVTWTNDDPIQHTTTSDMRGWDSGLLAPGATFTMTFDTPGTFTYHCNVHPFMHGTIQVTG
jgi:YVTN family beta-propeller protein